MSAAAAAAAAPATDAIPPKKSRKKLLIFVALAVLLLGAAGGGAALYLAKKRAAAAAEAAAEEADGDPAAHAAKGEDSKHDPSHPPAFMPLEPFVVNLADREVDRFAQVGITLELVDGKFADQLKPYMPAIRNGILMILAHKTAAELHERSGKEKLAGEIARAAVRPMGIEVEEPDADRAEGKDGAVPRRAKKSKPKDAPTNPVRGVLFSSFIIQ